MPVLKHRDRMVLFAHIPKTGGTSIEKFFKAHGVAIALSSQKLHGSARQGFPCSPQHFHQTVLSEMFPYSFFSANVAVVRHPVTRALSEYRHRMGILLGKGKSLISFERWVNGCLSKVARDPYFKDNHFRPQVEFIGNQTRIFKFEEGLQEPIQQIARSLNINLTKGFEIPIKNPGVQLEVEVSNRALYLIERFYEEDLDTFDYDPLKVDE